MFTLAKPKFEVGQKVKLREKLNYWIDKKTLGHFSRGHVFEVKLEHISHMHKDCEEAFNEGMEIFNPDFYYELCDENNYKIFAYEDQLKRVKVFVPEEEEIDEETMAARKLPQNPPAKRGVSGLKLVKT